MRVGVPSEIKVHEYRVGLTPGAVREYVAHGHQVVVQSGAGAGIMASDDAYRAAGAEIAATAAEIFAGCDMIVKVKEPQPSEWVLLRPGRDHDDVRVGAHGEVVAAGDLGFVAVMHKCACSPLRMVFYSYIFYSKLPN